jgi:hypothetical protein
LTDRPVPFTVQLPLAGDDRGGHIIIDVKEHDTCGASDS